ncbi:zinc carboxypeptidase A 1-like protein [Leptotrombidium deliense]|uniref:Zinc carboxypeptidase A 1-like protein n=1 Tax=Leptotrombidium deliense TaxID=299467 RepID=A0A443SCJ2_9ACAR|nr:zinc carboxypeptidase A 1-like protein [Leptotrombidium deliense]
MLNSDGIAVIEQVFRNKDNKALRNKSFRTDELLNLEIYHPFEEIEAILKMWEAAINQNVILREIGETHEKRAIYSLVLQSDNVSLKINQPKNCISKSDRKSVIFFECGIHAREWISPATCLYIANILLQHKDNDDSLLKKYDFHFIPVLNADGYAFSWKSNRMWRKNRNPGFIPIGPCYGVDLNRNFDSHHCGEVASRNPCDETFCGWSPFSERETSALRDYIETITINHFIKVYFSIHSYGQQWLFPYSYTTEPTKTDSVYLRLSQSATHAIRFKSGEEYEFGQVSRVTYKASGESTDWIEDNNYAWYTFTLELRDKGYYSFKLPEQFIKPTAEEIWEEIVDIYNKWTTKYPETIKTKVIGYTYENKPIIALTITGKSARAIGSSNIARANTKNIVFLECGVHAREWVSPATCLHIANTLLTNANNDASLLNNFDFHIIPVTNADGYVFTWKTNRMWRKNRNPGNIPLGPCYGVDLNRNFDVNFCGELRSRIPCDETYCGRSAFSENETQAIRDYIISLNSTQRIKIYFAIHSYSQIWMYSYGYTTSASAKDSVYHNMSQKATEAIKQTHGELYAFGQSSKVLYESSGTSFDWTEVNNLADFSFAIELRDKGDNGFILPPEFIKPTADEIWNGIKSVIE